MRNLVIAGVIGTLATYLPFWQWGDTQAAGAAVLSLMAWMALQGTEPEGRKP